MSAPWKTSLHGGHSGEFCEHAEATLRETLDAAVAFGYDTFGVSEHAPRTLDRFIYPSEREKGFTVERLHEDFEAYAREVGELAAEYSDRLTVLRGFEAECVPTKGYEQFALSLKGRHVFDYMVGSVHYVHETPIDGDPDVFQRLVAECGGLENTAVHYYIQVAQMVESLTPDVVGHLDLIRRHSAPDARLDTTRIRKAAEAALEAVRSAGSILDLNTAGWRKGLGNPYPAPWLVELAARMDIGFCFGDDSHKPSEVGAGIEEARLYLLASGVTRIRRITRREGVLLKEWVPLSAEESVRKSSEGE